MKKVLLLITAFIALSHVSKAQNVRLNGYAAYSFSDKFDSYYDPSNYYNGRINDGFQWGAGVEFMPSPYAGIEVSYYRKSTTAPTNYLSQGGIFQTPRTTNFDLNLNHILLNGTRYLRQEGSPIEGFGGFSLGASILDIRNPDNGVTNSITKFCWGARAGLNIWIVPQVALKFQAQLLSVVQSMGGSFYFGTGGSGVGLSSYSTVYQFSLGGGLVFNIAK